VGSCRWLAVLLSTPAAWSPPLFATAANAVPGGRHPNHLVPERLPGRTVRCTAVTPHWSWAPRRRALVVTVRGRCSRRTCELPRPALVIAHPGRSRA
jgi:hypothetical protein